MLSTPSAIARSKGGSSTVVKRSIEWGRAGNSRWESVAVSPCPGKCLAVVNTGLDCVPWINAVVRSATTSGRSPKALILITGLCGLLLTSTTGASIQLIPTARASVAVTLPISTAYCRARSRSRS